ncbi:MAG: nucleoside 2-deoxyribosyltransferase [Deltaproteobacteria bacterium]|jgi:nucleoside 2-deoxyribosyltransferase|nr:nucleoside 2-deoxyribosyltransferase [Deltaproteobacteria bacterium]
MVKNVFSIYWGGSLFNHKDLTGNALLAEYIETCSGNKYRCCLPQNVEQHQTTALDIRNKDIAKIIECDLGLFNFDGTELDAGVVVEFMLAKFLDIPAVILRSDFRTCGEKEIGGEDWNFMCSFYPRTRIVQFNAMLSYQEAVEESQLLNEIFDIYYSRIARLIVESLDSVRTEEPLLKGDQKRLETLYRWALTFPGGGIEKLISNTSFVDQILAAKIKIKIA